MIAGDIEGLKQKSNHLEIEIEKVREDSHRLVDEELDKLAERLKQKVDDLEAICGKNEKHVVEVIDHEYNLKYRTIKDEVAALKDITDRVLRSQKSRSPGL